MPASKKYHYPKSIPLFRFLMNAEAIRKNPIPFHKQYFQQLGDTFSVRIGRKKYVLLTRDPDIVQQVLQKNHKNYIKSKIQTHYVSKYLGNGLLTSNGTYWLKQRRLIQPAFHKQKMEQLLDLMNQTISAQVAQIPHHNPIDVFPITNQLAFQVVATSLFDLSITEAETKRLQTIMEVVQKFMVKEVRLPHKKWWFRWSGQERKHLQLAKESRDIIEKIIEERRLSKQNHHDLLDMLLATRYEDSGEAMTTSQLIDEITILFVAGHETTANALSFTLYLLAKHPAIQEKAFEEIQKVEKGLPSVSEKIQQLVYIKAIIDESMRLYPPAWITDRENLEDDTLKEYFIKADTMIGISFYELHRHPAYWENPNDFIPDRFLNKNTFASNAYYPFGAGPRMCIGMGFAVYEMVLAISQILCRFSITTQVQEAKINPLITLKPVDLKVTFAQR
ncbi:MAG: cytochrome P450 [Flavobacteriaceae bacterium]